MATHQKQSLEIIRTLQPLYSRMDLLYSLYLQAALVQEQEPEETTVRPLFSERYQPIIPWVETNIYLGRNSPIPGRIKLFPWQKPILEAYTDPMIQQITLMTASQASKSTMFLCMMGYSIGVSPVNALLVQPGIKILDRFINEKVIPMLEESPELASRVKRTNHKNIKRDHIAYDGGNIFTAYAGSPASLRSLTAERVFADEIDTYKGNMDTANPISIIKQRMLTFGDRAKIVVASTPVDTGNSWIEQEFIDGSSSFWHVPCPHCSIFHKIEWENVLENKLYCPSCSQEIIERERREIIYLGQWVEDSPNPKHKSFQISQLYSTWKDLSVTAQEYDEANPRGFWTQVLGLPWQNLVEAAIQPEGVEALYESQCTLEDGTILTRETADAITVAVDIQKNRLEAQFNFWKGMYPRVDRHMIIPFLENLPDGMDPMDIAFETLNIYLNDYKPDRIFIDRHYPDPDTVDMYAKRHLMQWIMTQRLWLIVGVDKSFNKPFIYKWPNTKTPYYGSLSIDVAKEWVHNMIRNKAMSINSAQGAVPKNPNNAKDPENFSRQLSAEELRWITTNNGTQQMKWVRIRKRNEALDCMVYNACARRSLGDDYRRIAGISVGDMVEINNRASSASR